MKKPVNTATMTVVISGYYCSEKWWCFN